MSSLTRIAFCVLSLAVAAGCASTEVSDRQRLVTEKLPRPGHIWVYDFAATPAEVPAGSALANQPTQHATPQTPEQIELGQKLGAQIAAQLVEEIRDMALPAKRASSQTTPEINDIVLRGYLLSIEEGSATKRVAIGFGYGASELTTAVEGFQMTAQGLRKLGSGKVNATGGKTPGGAVGVAAVIATANPAGLIIGGGMKAYGEYSGKSKIEGRAKDTTKGIMEVLKKRFQEEGWIS
jgi:Domain of unknown function (DUF4410)